MLLLTNPESIQEWDAFAQIASRHWRIVALWDVTAFQLVQSVWAIGEPVALCTNGTPVGNVALRAQSIAPGAIPLVALIDFEPNDGAIQTDGRVAIVRGRQSERLSHQDAVKARQVIGDTCQLVEIENCGNNAAASCPSEFEAAISWLWSND